MKDKFIQNGREGQPVPVTRWIAKELSAGMKAECPRRNNWKAMKGEGEQP